MMWVLSLAAIAAIQPALASHYILVTTPKKWADAEAYCKATFKTNLASIPNAAFNADANAVRKGKHVWIGLADWKQEKKWLWSDVTPARYFNWDKGQPDNYKSCEDCAEMWGNAGKWNDNNCDTAKAFLCNSPKPVMSANYIYVSAPKSWSAANAWCRTEFKTTLAGIPSSARNAEAFRLTKGDTWFGYSDAAREGHWRNADKSWQLWKNWSPGQPDNFKGNQDCALLWPKGVWDDQGCDREIPFLCNRRNPPPQQPLVTPNYIFVPLKKNWVDANAYCRARWRTTLAGIPNGARNHEVFERAKQIDEVFWFGLNDRMAEGTWDNADGSEQEWTNWAPGEPNNAGKNEDCGLYYPTGNWNDLRCDVAFYFICNRRNPPPIRPVYTANYIYVGLKRSWHEANDYCKSRFRTTLAGIPNAARNHEMYLLRKRVGQNYWFGLNDLGAANEGKWVNADGTLVMWTNWAPGEPNNGGGKGQDCGQYYAAGNWDDDSCDKRKPFVCNRRVPPPPHFVYVPTGKKWADARDYCKNTFKTSLAKVDTPAKNIEANFLRKGQHVWIGLSDFKQEKKFLWNDLSVARWTNWDAGQPDNAGLCEDCVEMWKKEGKWNDNRCEAVKPFLCNSPPPPKEYTIGQHFIFVREPMNWLSANAYCQTHFKTKLAKISNLAQNQETRALGKGHAWIGLNDRKQEGQWKWANGSPAPYTNWVPGEPNDAGQAEDCAEMYPDGRWNDNRCDVSRVFFCNRKARAKYEEEAIGNEYGDYDYEEEY